MAKNQGPWGNNDNANPWGDNEETLNSPKVVDFSVLERIKKDDGFESSFFVVEKVKRVGFCACFLWDLSLTIVIWGCIINPF